MRIPKSWQALTDETARAARRRRRVRATLARQLKSRRGGSIALVNPAVSARAAGLYYVADTMPGWKRVGKAARLRYLDESGRTIRRRDSLARIRALAIPPAWTDVWICARADGHLQATGRDARGRKQYRYHPRWREVRDDVKYGRLTAFGQSLPRIRERVEQDLCATGLTRERVLAAVVQLLERTLIRIGNDEYARQNGSIGLTTMKDGHARIEGATVRFAFKGKSGISHGIDLHDRRLARIVKACRDLPGYELFQYIDDQGQQRSIGSADVNDYLREISGQDFTAKDFRTWAGTVLAARALSTQCTFTSAAEAKRNVVKAIEAVAKRLGNTKAVCRKSYIHPAVLDGYLSGRTISPESAAASERHALAPDERCVLELIQAPLEKSA